MLKHSRKQDMRIHRIKAAIQARDTQKKSLSAPLQSPGMQPVYLRRGMPLILCSRAEQLHRQ